MSAINRMRLNQTPTKKKPRAKRKAAWTPAENEYLEQCIDGYMAERNLPSDWSPNAADITELFDRLKSLFPDKPALSVLQKLKFVFRVNTLINDDEIIAHAPIPSTPIATSSLKPAANSGVVLKPSAPSPNPPPVSTPRVLNFDSVLSPRPLTPRRRLINFDEEVDEQSSSTDETSEHLIHWVQVSYQNRLYLVFRKLTGVKLSVKILDGNCLTLEVALQYCDITADNLGEMIKVFPDLDDLKGPKRVFHIHLQIPLQYESAKVEALPPNSNLLVWSFPMARSSPDGIIAAEIVM